MRMRDRSGEAWNIEDLREIARKRMPKGIFEFIDRGAEDEVALRHNRVAFEQIKLRPRVLADVANRSQAVTLFGRKQNMPIAVAPTGSTGLMCYQGELALARACAKASIPYTIATGSTTSVEEAAGIAGTLWFQLYMWPEFSMTKEVVLRAKAVDAQALIVTVDGPVSGNREYNARNGYTVPFTFTRRNVTDVLMHPGWLFGVLGRYMVTTGMPGLANYPRELQTKITARPMGKALLRNDGHVWDDIRALRKLWPNALLVKGVQHPEDAKIAADCGADGVVLSNHGGRIVDSSMAPIEVLPEVVDAVGARMTVLIDSGFRRGSDVVKAIALGAKGVLIGRPLLYGAAAGGEAGAARAIGFYREEIDRLLAQIGCANITDLNRNWVSLPR
jgi:isopentenyl diphosphate isomerase/L-lactate dehydrogenase-like FMN-dependent dehydrogenase